MQREIRLEVEELEERIAPAIMTITPPAGPTTTVPADLPAAAVAADTRNGISVV